MGFKLGAERICRYGVRIGLSLACAVAFTVWEPGALSVSAAEQKKSKTSETRKTGRRLSKVPPGNRNKIQPRIPFISSNRTRSHNKTFEQKFDRIVRTLTREHRLVRKIKSVSKTYGIEPIHMVGAIVGEHTYNYDNLDTLQGYYIKAASYLKLPIEFKHAGHNVEDFVQQPPFHRCNKLKRSSSVWACRERVWDKVYRGRRVDGVKYSSQKFGEAFFQPLFAGQSFGLGQLHPLTVLKMSDQVSRISKFKKLKETNEREVYRAAMDPDRSLHYMAAIIKDAITAYRTVGKVDISGNPGVVATLYNLGDPWARARSFRDRGRAYPEENYYGWLVNDRLKELSKLVK
ncbi:DUF1402 family protein [Coralliovum pocilloporae]|uniref:DUF1402 family protein n=1 Tax=Coralliovum pocilloporae TaxID=3066369 RepID=UPI003306FA61